jgi:hypothetical protein
MGPAETRRLAAIMLTDIVGFSRQMGADEDRMLRILAVHHQMIQRRWRSITAQSSRRWVRVCGRLALRRSPLQSAPLFL